MAAEIIRNRIVAHTEEDPAQLLANPLNFRRHPGAQRDALRGSVKELGWIKSVLVNRTTQHVIDGHARCEEAISLGAKVPVDWVEMSLEEERLALAVLDPITEMATRDDEVLAGLLKEVSTRDDGLLALLEQLRAESLPKQGEMFTDADAVPDPPKKAKTKRGSIYLLGKHRLLCGDATSQEDIARLMGGTRASMVWTDPPYNVAYEGKTADRLTIQNDQMSGVEFREFLKSAFACMLWATKGGGAFYVAHADVEAENFLGSLREAGWSFRQCLIWVKNAMVLGRRDYHFKHEPILYGWKPGAAHNWCSDRKQTTVLEFDRPDRSAEHPTMKPVALIEYCLNNSSKPGAAVLDVFGGSGSTLIACEKTNRRGYLMELDPIYCDVIVKRWEEATGKKAILDANG